MIYESKFWKKDLLKQAKNLRVKSTQKRWTEDSYFRFEQTVLLGFYSIRKLVEARKLSNAVAEQRIDLAMYRHVGNPVTVIGKRKLDKLYDLSEEETVSRNLAFVCNKFVHSYVFEECFDSEGNFLVGILFNSDKDRNKFLYYIEIQKLIEIFEQVGNDYPTHIHYTTNMETLDYDVHAWTEEIPMEGFDTRTNRFAKV
jgi:hypothetical protein